MSDQNSSFPFTAFGQEEGLDYAAIFGGGDSAGDVNPFEALAAQQAEPAASPPPASGCGERRPAGSDGPRTPGGPGTLSRSGCGARRASGGGGQSH